MGVMLVDGSKKAVLRPVPPKHPFVVIRLLHPSPHATTAQQAAANGVSVEQEWINLGLNLGGAVLSGIGVVGSVALAPETGGATGVGAVMLWGGLTASVAQTGNSVTRLWKIYHGQSKWVSNLDHNAVYQNVSLGVDLFGLFSAGAVVRETVATGKALGRAGSSFSRGLGQLSRPQRFQLTRELELQGSRRVAAERINKVLQLKLLDAFAATYGTAVSAYNGVAHNIAVYIVYPSGTGH